MESVEDFVKVKWRSICRYAYSLAVDKNVFGFFLFLLIFRLFFYKFSLRSTTRRMVFYMERDLRSPLRLLSKLESAECALGEHTLIILSRYSVTSVNIHSSDDWDGIPAMAPNVLIQKNKKKIGQLSWNKLGKRMKSSDLLHSVYSGHSWEHNDTADFVQALFCSMSTKEPWVMLTFNRSHSPIFSILKKFVTNFTCVFTLLFDIFIFRLGNEGWSSLRKSRLRSCRPVQCPLWTKNL